MKAGNARTRIVAGFGAAVILATMTLGVFAYARLLTIKGTATRITRDAMPCIYLMGKLQSATLLHYTLLTDYMNADNSSGKTALDGQIDNANRDIDDFMRKYERLIGDAEDRRLYETLKAARSPYTECYMRVLRLSREGRRNAAVNLIAARLIPLRNAVFQAAEAEVVWNKADADDAANAIMSAVNWSSTGILISLALSMGIGGIAHDIRKRLLAERTLREGEQRFRGVFQQAPFGMCVSGLDGRFMQVNAAFCRILGYSEEELLGLAWSGLTHPYDLELSLRLKDQLCDQPDGCVEADKRYLHRSGAVVWAHIKVAMIRDPGGAPLYHVVHVEDITERRRAEQALHDSEERFRIMADGCPAVMWVTNAEGGIQFINRAFRELVDGTCEKMEGQKWQMVLHPEDAPEYVAALQRAVREHTPFRAETRAQRVDGEWRWFASYAEPRFSPDGEFLGHVGLSPDITERKRREEALRAVEERYRMLAHALESAGECISITDTEDRILYVNDAFLRTYGYRQHELIGQHVSILRSARTSPEMQSEILPATMAGKWRGEIWNRTREGREFPISLATSVVRDESGRRIALVGFARDITETQASRASLAVERREVSPVGGNHS